MAMERSTAASSSTGGVQAPPKYTLAQSRERARSEVDLLPPPARSLTQSFRPAVHVAPAIVELASELDHADSAVQEDDTARPTGWR